MFESKRNFWSNVNVAWTRDCATNSVDESKIRNDERLMELEMDFMSMRID